MNLHSGMILRKSNYEVKVLNTFRWLLVIILNSESVDILLIIIDMMSIHGRKNISFHYFSCFNHGKIEELKNGYDTYAASFHEIKLHLAEALQYHEQLEEL